LPLLFTRSAQLPLPLLSGWLQHVAVFNPGTYAIDSMRLLLNGPNAVAEPSPLILTGKTLVVLAVIAVITMTLAVRSFRKSVR